MPLMIKIGETIFSREAFFVPAHVRTISMCPTYDISSFVVLYLNSVFKIASSICSTLI